MGGQNKRGGGGDKIEKKRDETKIILINFAQHRYF